jgi:hypothetical protein
VHPFVSFGDAADLAAQLKSGAAGRLNREELDSLWADDWRRRYLQFLRDVGGVGPEFELAAGAV